MTWRHRRIVLFGLAVAAAVPSTPKTQDLESSMQLYRSGSLPTNRPPEPTFMGKVAISGYFQREAPSRLAGATVTIEPGARTPWKVNPLGQTLIVTSGNGWAQCGGEAIVEIGAGDMIWCPPGQRHWEGATSDRPMTYVAIHEGTVQFGEQVTDAEYRKGPSTSSVRR